MPHGRYRGDLSPLSITSLPESSESLQETVVPRRTIMEKCSYVLVLIIFPIVLESCAHSVKVVTEERAVPTFAGKITSGTLYVGVDLSRMTSANSLEARAMADTLGQSIASNLTPAFAETRFVADVTRIETGPPDAVLFVRARNATLRSPVGEISGGWLRAILVAVLGEVYSVFSLDFPRYRNTVALPLIGLAFPLFEIFYAYHYEPAPGWSSIEYQISLLKSDGSVVNRCLLADSARVLFQADAGAKDFRTRDLFEATRHNVSATIGHVVLNDTTTLATIGEAMRQAYHNDCDRLLTLKRNLYRVVDDTASGSWLYGTSDERIHSR